MENKPYISIVVPLLNEEAVFPLFLKEMRGIMNGSGLSYELIFVDDGSTDSTLNLIKAEAIKDKRVKAISFSRNFGHQAAFNAGIDLAEGDVVVTMDGDLQHPPKLILDFVKYSREGFDIVIGERLDNKQNSKLREYVGRTIYRIMSAITGLEFKNASDFALYNRGAVSALKSLPERERFLRGMVQWIGFKKKYVPYVVDLRKAGYAKYTFKKLAGLITSGITSFSAVPLRLAFWLGLLMLVVSVCFSSYVVWDHYTNPNPFIAGWATLVILIMFIGSMQLIVLGVVGEYLYKMFNEIKGRPLYIVRDMLNINRDRISKTPYGVYVSGENSDSVEIKK